MVEKIIAEIACNGNTFAILTQDEVKELERLGYKIEYFEGFESLITKE